MNARVVQGLAIGLSTLAGFVDAIGYLAVGNLFVAFMSGNSTVLGISMVEGLGERTLLSGGLVVMFVAGVMVGTWVGRPFGARRAPVVLLLMSTLLVVAGLLGVVGLGGGGLTTPCCLVVALAMGAENTVFQRAGVSGIGLTYMTGTLVRLGQKAAEAVAGGPWAAAVPDTLLWFGMVAGAAAGAAVEQWIGLNGLWVAAATGVGMAGVAHLSERRAVLG